MVTLNDQMERQVVGPVILINKFNVKSYEVEQFLKAGKKMLLSSKSKQGLFLHSYMKA
jgi:hypothetical protein